MKDKDYRKRVIAMCGLCMTFNRHKNKLMNGREVISLKIYFAGSIRGGRQDVGVYEQIIRFLQNYGEVLTEHVGNSQLSSDGQHELDDRYIHDRDLEWLKSSDVIVAETSVPSLGVGYELANGELEGIPILVLHRRSSRQLSAMVQGAGRIECHEYDSIDHAKEVLKTRLEAMAYDKE